MSCPLSRRLPSKTGRRAQKAGGRNTTRRAGVTLMHGPCTVSLLLSQSFLAAPAPRRPQPTNSQALCKPRSPSAKPKTRGNSSPKGATARKSDPSQPAANPPPVKCPLLLVGPPLQPQSDPRPGLRVTAGQLEGRRTDLPGPGSGSLREPAPLNGVRAMAGLGQAVVRTGAQGPSPLRPFHMRPQENSGAAPAPRVRHSRNSSWNERMQITLI